MIKSAWLMHVPFNNDTHWLVMKSFGILHFQSAKLHPLEEWLPLWIQLTRFFQMRWTVECDFTAVCLFFWFVNKYIDNYNFEPSIWYPYVATELIMWIQQGSMHLQIVYDVLPCLFDQYPRPYIVSWTSWVFGYTAVLGFFKTRIVPTKFTRIHRITCPIFRDYKKPPSAEFFHGTRQCPLDCKEEKTMGEQSLHYLQTSILGYFRCFLSRLHMLDI